MDAKLKKENHLRVAEQAAQWLDILEAASEAERRGFVEWILESRLNLEQFLFVSAIAREGRGLAEIPGDVEALIAQAKTNVVELGADTEEHDTQPDAAVSRRGLALGIAASTLLCVGLAYFWIRHTPTTLTTETGEQRTVPLTDGSMLYLSAQSQVKVKFTGSQREIELTFGEAFFNVAPDSQRPFRVRTDKAVIEALGTQFDVHRRSSGTIVSVLEGSVRVGPVDLKPPHEAAPVQLSAGEGVRVDTSGRVTHQATTSIPVEKAPWHRPRLSFDEDTLADIAADFNRFNRSPKLQIEGEALLQKRFTGNFNADDPSSLIAFLRVYTPLEVRESESEIRVKQALAP